MTTNIYILRLEGGKWYVGKTNNVIQRLQEHLNGTGSTWTKKYKPISLEKTLENVSPFEEDKVTKEYMAKYGIDRVRGGTYVTETLEQAQIDVVRENKLASCYLRPLIWIGSEKLGIAATNNTIHAAVAAWAWGAYLGDEAMAKGIRVKTSSFTHHHPNVTMCKAKASGNYTLSILAHQEVAHSGYDEAMLMDPQGYVCQGSGENVFLIKDGVLHTPDIAGGALDGITRQTVMTIARDLGYQVVERRITRDEFYIADEAFFTGTAAEVTPIREYDDRPIGSGTRGPITTEIQKTYFDAVQGRNPKYEHWLTYVK
jgi:branched-chain amino acid aminotransferase